MMVVMVVMMFTVRVMMHVLVHLTRLFDRLLTRRFGAFLFRLFHKAPPYIIRCAFSIS